MASDDGYNAARKLVAWDTRPPASDQPVPDRLAGTRVSERSPFVGREPELRVLCSAFESAAAGDGRLSMLVGEPGIGKTAVCEQLATFVSAFGGRALVGHCYEEGSLRAPYQPFVEIFATYLQGRDIQALSADPGSGLAELTRMVPSLRQRLTITTQPPGDPEEDRWRLLQAATDVLRSAAATQPLLVVVEDLHDADRGTLDLLLYLARNLHGARLLVVGTYRDVEVERTHPLSAALGELRRASNVARVHLNGLSTDEVLRVLAETSGQRIPQPLAEMVHRQTEGNPLFVHEMLRYVVEAGLVERQDGVLRRVGDEPLASRIPEGLRDVVGKRLSRLSDATNRVLGMASVIGREFELEVLRRVLERPDEELERALEEASAAGIIEERWVVGATITYRFSHAFFRQTLYDEIVAPRRIRLHQRVARALEEVHAGRLEDHVSALAEHYACSSDASDLTNAVRYGELAAARASDAFAYGEAARQLERALLVLDLVGPDDQARQCDLLLALGEALLPLGETERVIQRVAPDAFALAEALSDRVREFRACRLALNGYIAQGANSSAALPEYLNWAQRAQRYANSDSTERVYADLALALALSTQSRRHEARGLQLAALALARRLNDPEGLFRSAGWVMINFVPRQWEEWQQLAQEFSCRSRAGVTNRTLGVLLWHCGCVKLALGDRSGAEKLWREVEELAERTHADTLPLFAGQCQVAWTVIDGHLEQALVLLRRFVERADENGTGVRARLFGLGMLLYPALHLGRATDWLTAFDEHNRLAGAPSAGLTLENAARAVCLAELGRVPEARELAEPWLDAYTRASEDDAIRLAVTVLLLHGAVRRRDREAAQVLSDRLARVAHMCVGDFVYTCVARHLGEAAVLLGDRASARTYYAQALETAGKIGFRPELALTHLQLAELLLGQPGDEFERLEALEHLDSAIPELENMHMQPSLEHALSLRGTHAPRTRRQAAVRPLASDGLTAREREIVGLMTTGLSNREIAEHLVITEGTVEVHVKHVLSKLGLKSRTQVAAWFARRGSA